MQERIKAEVERQGFHYISDRPLSNHDRDRNLRIVHGFSSTGTHVTWEYNDEFGGLYFGHYDMTTEEALEDFSNR